MHISNEKNISFETPFSIEESEVSKLQLEELVDTALRAVYKYDKYLIDIKAHERDIVFRFGIYFQGLLIKHEKYNKYNLDVEYNRNLYDPKKTENFNNGVYPDVILHERGNNDNNILVLEFKGYWNNRKDEIEKDKSKLWDLMNPTGDYKYKKGYIVILETNSFERQPFYLTLT